MNQGFQEHLNWNANSSQREYSLVFYAKRKLESFEMRMRGVYIGKGFRVSLNGFLMWDRRSEKQGVGNKKSRVRTTRSLYGCGGCTGLIGEERRRSREAAAHSADRQSKSAGRCEHNGPEKITFVFWFAMNWSRQLVFREAYQQPLFKTEMGQRRRLI